MKLQSLRLSVKVLAAVFGVAMLFTLFNINNDPASASGVVEEVGPVEVVYEDQPADVTRAELDREIQKRQEYMAELKTEEAEAEEYARFEAEKELVEKTLEEEKTRIEQERKQLEAELAELQKQKTQAVVEEVKVAVEESSQELVQQKVQVSSQIISQSNIVDLSTGANVSPEFFQQYLVSEYNQTQCDDVVATEVLKLINNLRSENSLNNVNSHLALTRAACNHAVYMSLGGGFDHVGEYGYSAEERCAAVGASCDGENIAMHSSPDAQNFFELWVGSQAHKDMMLGSHTDAGIGVYGQYAVVNFR